MSASPKERLLLWVDGQHQLDPRTKLILLKLALYADADCRAWSKVDTLAAGANSSVRIVQLRLRDMERDGLIARTPDEHTLNPGSRFPRKVPIYQLAVGVEGCDPACASGANFAPEDEGSGAAGDALGCNRRAPRKEPKEPTLANASDAGAGGREALFERLEAAYHRRGLGFTNRDRAGRVFGELLDAGLPPEGLIASAAAWTADKSVKSRDLGLDHWLHDRKFRGWWPEPAAAAAPSAERAAGFDPPAEVRAAILAVKDAAWMSTWLGQASWRDGVIVCRLGLQADTVRAALRAPLAELGVEVTDLRSFETSKGNA